MCSCFFSCLSCLFPCSCKSSKVGISFEEQCKLVIKGINDRLNPQVSTLDGQIFKTLADSVGFSLQGKNTKESYSRAYEFLKQAVFYDNQHEQLVKNCKLFAVMQGHDNMQVDNWVKSAIEEYKIYLQEREKHVVQQMKSCGLPI